MANATVPSGHEPSDEELARHSQAGSRAAFETLVTRHQHAVYRYLLGSTGQEADAWDLSQAVWIAAYQAMHRYRPAQPFLPWLFTIARRKFLDHCRVARRRVSLEVTSDTETDADPASKLAMQEDRSQLWQCVRDLVSPDQFTALWLHYAEDLPLQDIARVLGRTQTSVKVILFRARRVLLRHWRAVPAVGRARPPSDPAWSGSGSPQPLTSHHS
jgi:RNA polymerase sigma-70 factor (ECF subfamily)